MPATVSAPRRWLIVVLALAIAVVCGYSLGVRTSKPAIGALPMKTALAAFNRSATASAADPIVMQIAGIPGVSTVPGHTNWIDLNSWQFGASARPPSAPNFSDVTVSASMSPAIPPLLSALAKGTVLPKVEIDFVDTSGPTPFSYLLVTLTSAHLTSLSMSSGGDIPDESISFAYAQVQLIYKVPTATGATSYRFCWNLTTGAC